MNPWWLLASVALPDDEMTWDNPQTAQRVSNTPTTAHKKTVFRAVELPYMYNFHKQMTKHFSEKILLLGKSCYIANITAHTPWPTCSDKILMQVMELLTSAHIPSRNKALKRRDSFVAAQNSNQTSSGKENMNTKMARYSLSVTSNGRVWHFGIWNARQFSHSVTEAIMAVATNPLPFETPGEISFEFALKLPTVLAQRCV